MRRVSSSMVACAFGLALATGSAFAAPTPTVTTLNFSLNPVGVGGASDITATVTPVPTTGGHLSIEALVDGVTHAPLPCGVTVSPSDGVTPTEYINAAGPNLTVGSITLHVVTAVVGSFGYRGHFAPAGSGLGQSQSPCANLNVVGPVCQGLHISAINTSGGNPVAGTVFSGSFRIEVTNCGPNVALGVTAQGGTSAWTTISGILPSADTSVTTSGKGGGNVIIKWKIGDMPPGATATLNVNLSGLIKAGTPVGSILGLNGNWSATSAGAKTDYTDKITITTVAP